MVGFNMPPGVSPSDIPGNKESVEEELEVTISEFIFDQLGPGVPLGSDDEEAICSHINAIAKILAKYDG